MVEIVLETAASFGKLRIKESNFMFNKIGYESLSLDVCRRLMRKEVTPMTSLKSMHGHLFYDLMKYNQDVI